MVIGCLRLSDVSVIWRVVNRVGRRRKFGEVSCTECTRQKNDFELIPTVKEETINSAEVILVMNFWRFVIIAELWRPKVARH